MRESAAANGPVAIGGVGGSGTRVLAEMLSLFGFHLGSDLNEASDCLVYTLLFKRREWFYRNHGDRREIGAGLSLLGKVLTGRGLPTARELGFLWRAVREMARAGHNLSGDGKGNWAFERLRRLWPGDARAHENAVGWGWKEPNSHLLVAQITEHFANAKYVHTVRHGLDMAFSRNQQQLYNWGDYFGVPPPASVAEEPRASLRYWLRANERVLEVGNRLGPSRFLLVDYDRLCLSPEGEIQKLLAFLDVRVDQGTYEQAVALPRVPASMGRYKQHDLGQFDESDLVALARLGFSC